MKDTLDEWRKARASHQEGDCVTVHRTLRALRDSKNPSAQLTGVNVALLVQRVKVGQLST